MSSRCRSGTAVRRMIAPLLAAASMALIAHPLARAGDAELRVCADPDNLPFSAADESGFENRIARVVADDLHAKLRYEWLPQVRGYVRKTMGAGLCDVFVGVPADFERVLTTKPYYRSSYVFVSRAAAPLASFDDPRVTRLRIGVQLVGNDLAATPPGYALAARGAVDNVSGFTLFGTPPSGARIVAAIANGELDAGVLWGPQGGFFAAEAAPRAALSVLPARAPDDLAAMPFEYGIAMGVRRGNAALRDRLDAVLVRRRHEIDAILAAYHVPRTDRP